MNTSENMLTIGKGIALLTTSGAVWVADSIAAQLDAAPNWIDKYGLPIAMLLLALAAIVMLHKGLRQSEKDRIEDRKEDSKRWQEAYEKSATNSQSTREKLVESTTAQNLLLEDLIEKIEKIIK